VYAAAFEFEPCDFATGGNSTPYIFPNQTYGAVRTHVRFWPKFPVWG